jgi:hypothetical protein
MRIERVRKEFNPKLYMRLSQDDLVTVSLYFVLESGDTPTFEKLVAECFERFPQRFALLGYPQWPNAAVINKSWLRCRTDKKLITGNVAGGFNLTPSGKHLVEKTLVRLNAKPISSMSLKKGDKQTMEGRVVERIEKSPAYEKFQETKSLDDTTEYEASDLFYATMESTPEILLKNYEIMLQHLQNYNREDLIEFVKKIREKFNDRFGGVKPRGGMMPKKTTKNRKEE